MLMDMDFLEEIGELLKIRKIFLHISVEWEDRELETEGNFNF